MRIVLAIFLFVSVVSCNSKVVKQKGENKEKGIAKFEFQQDFHNFGKLEAGEVVSFSFEIKNTGTSGLEIEKIETDCGCLKVDYSKYKIKPGDKSYIEVLFNSAGEIGKVYKTITIFTNAETKQKKLSIAATVNNKMINLYSKN